MAKPQHRGARIAIVGGETLLGREVRELLESGGVAGEVSLFSAEDEHTGILTKQRDEPSVMPPLSGAVLGSAGLLILAGSPDTSARARALVRSSGRPPVVIDVSGSLEEDPEARLRAPMVETPGAGVAGPLLLIAHPAAIALCLLLERLQTAGPIRRSVVLAFEPASERGQPGLDELQQQTVGLLSFKKLSKDVFDAQLAFNLLPRYGEEAPRALETVELKIDRHLASLLANGNVPMPSLRLIQAPVFHGYSFSVWVEFEENPGVEALRAALVSPQIDLRGSGEEPPTNVGAAGQNGITVGEIFVDRNHPRACWLWMVADNLRIAAENAVEVAREALA